MLDVILSITMLIITFPILLFSILGLIIATRGFSVFFLQKRPGINGELFTLYKLKTMKDIDHLDKAKLKDSERLTKIGKFLRKYSIDELPQLLNVIKGNMSLVGPRPLLPEYFHFYSAEQAKRHLVKPGITGWAQINGRNNSTFDERINYDVWYVNNISFLLDLHILFKTALLVFQTANVLMDDPNKFFEQKNNKKTT